MITSLLKSLIAQAIDESRGMRIRIVEDVLSGSHTSPFAIVTGLLVIAVDVANMTGLEKEGFLETVQVICEDRMTSIEDKAN